MKQNINQDIAMAIFNSTDRPSQSRNIVSLREKVESYVNQRVIEELEDFISTLSGMGLGVDITSVFNERIKELKQD